jgi:hypothetical protein
MALRTDAPLAATRRAAVTAARSAVLATHCAAGVCISADREASRLIRAAEALCRLAVTRLETVHRGRAARAAEPVLRGVGGAGAAPAPAAAVPATPPPPSAPRRHRKPRVRKVAEMAVCPNVRAGEDADMGIAGSLSLQDEWADAARVPRHAPLHVQAAAPLLLPLAGSRVGLLPGSLPSGALDSVSAGSGPGAQGVSMGSRALPSWRSAVCASLPGHLTPEQVQKCLDVITPRSSPLIEGKDYAAGSAG